MLHSSSLFCPIVIHTAVPHIFCLLSLMATLHVSFLLLCFFSNFTLPLIPPHPLTSFSLNKAVILLASLSPSRCPDDVRPEDFIGLYLPAGMGLSVSANVWHAPPILATKSRTSRGEWPLAVFRTRQAAVHSKIYYDPVAENGCVLQVSLVRPAAILMGSE